MSLLRYCLLLAWLLCFPLLASAGGIRLSISDNLPADIHVLVETEIVPTSQNHSKHEQIGVFFLQPGQTKTLPTAGSTLLLYNKVVVTALHPAYVATTITSQEAPNLVGTVELLTIELASWRSVLDGAQFANPPPTLPASLVSDHFRLILRDYLPAFDRTGGGETLDQYLPLMRDLLTFSARTEGGYRLQAEQRLKELEAWFALPLERRQPMHDWIDNFHRPGYVFQQIMQRSDRQKIDSLLGQNIKGGYMKQHSWINKATQVHFSFELSSQDRSTARAVLVTDLNPRLGLDGNTAYMRKSFPRFIRDFQGHWALQ